MAEQPLSEGAVRDDAVLEQAPQPVRLSILHLVLWLTGAGLLLSFAQRTPDQPSPVLVFLLAISAINAVVYGWSISCLHLPFTARGRRSFPVHPGHWLLIAFAMISLFRLVLGWTYILLAPDGGLAVVMTAQSLDRLFYAAAFLFIPIYSRPWRRGFVLLAALHFLGAFVFVVGAILMWRQGPPWLQSNWAAYWMTSPTQCTAVGAVVLLLGLVALDLGRRERRDWLHWTGVLVALFGPLMVWVTYLGLVTL